MSSSRRTWIKNTVGISLGFCPSIGSMGFATERTMDGFTRPVPDSVYTGGSAFGTHWSVRALAEVKPEKLKTDIQHVIDSIDQSMSPYKPGSEICAFNRAEKVDWYPLSNSMRYVIQTNLWFASVSEGRFDPTIGPLVNRYGFGPITGDNHPDYQALQLNGHHLKKYRPGLTLDLCATAKGYCIDLIADYLIDTGVTEFLIECGGELRASGNHPSGRRWQVGIEHPNPRSDKLYAVIHLDNMALATSSTQLNAFEHRGQRYNHLIDSRERTPIRQNLLSVSVLNNNALLADGWATTLLLSGTSHGTKLAKEHNISAMFIVDDHGTLRNSCTGQFKGYLLQGQS